MACQVQHFVMQSIRADSFIYRLGHLVLPYTVSLLALPPGTHVLLTGAAIPQHFIPAKQEPRGKIALSLTSEIVLDLYYTTA